ncbi:MAG TPA: hypothetical protein PLJ35_05095 [Anaerolineae bacterium]|nr:hypothetical protein [Anaerolineae bacterium]
MTTLGLDPGTATCGWCLLDRTKLLCCGEVHLGDKHTPWPVKLRAAEMAFADIVSEHAPDLIAYESTQPCPSREGDTPGRAFSMQVNTLRTVEIIQAIERLAGQHGIETVPVHPASGLKALGCKRGATDGDVARAFTALFGQKCLARENHIARAAGVALRGETEARLQREKALRLEVPA